MLHALRWITDFQTSDLTSSVISQSLYTNINNRISNSTSTSKQFIVATLGPINVFLFLLWDAVGKIYLNKYHTKDISKLFIN